MAEDTDKEKKDITYHWDEGYKYGYKEGYEKGYSDGGGELKVSQAYQVALEAARQSNEPAKAFKDVYKDVLDFLKDVPV